MLALNRGQVLGMLALALLVAVGVGLHFTHHRSAAFWVSCVTAALCLAVLVRRALAPK